MKLRPLLALVLLGLACARNPVTGRPEFVLTTTEREVAIGADLAREVDATVGLVDDPELVAYVAAVGERLAARSPRGDVAYHFQVVEMAEPNAFALPGGYIFVSRGLLAIANSEAELAGLLGHEVVHVAARHAVQRHTRSIPLGVLAAVGAMVGGIVPSDDLARAIGALPQVAGSLVLAKYSRDQEREADRVGQALAAEAGWDPAALADLLQTLEAAVALQRGHPGAGSGRPGFFDSHPATPERIDAARERAARLERGTDPPIAASREAFLRVLEGMRVGPDPAEGVFRGPLFLHPDLRIALRFPEGWSTRNSRQAVAAVAPDRHALLVLKLQERGDDPEAAAVAFARKVGLTLTELEHLEVNGIPAVRGLAGVKSGGKTFVADLTFIAHEGLVYRITGAAPVSEYERRAATLADAVLSFRPLTDAERASFTARQLRLERARPGETLEAFSRRTGNAWSLGELAVANGLGPRRPLAGGLLLKLAREEPYAPAESAPSR